ncbi:hypothetical protein D3C78_1079960 [compost metagenome]
MQAHPVVEATGWLCLETPQVPGDRILYQVTPGQASHQPLIRSPFHDDSAAPLVACFAKRIVSLGQQSGKIVITITTGDADHGERSRLTHGIDDQIGDAVIDKLRQVLELRQIIGRAEQGILGGRDTGQRRPIPTLQQLFQNLGDGLDHVVPRGKALFTVQIIQHVDGHQHDATLTSLGDPGIDLADEIGAVTEPGDSIHIDPCP